MADLTITIKINDTDQTILKNRLADINDWCQNAITGQINFAWNLMREEWTTKLMDDDSFTDPIPSTKNEFVALVTARSDYKTQAERDAESIEKPE